MKSLKIAGDKEHVIALDSNNNNKNKKEGEGQNMANGPVEAVTPFLFLLFSSSLQDIPDIQDPVIKMLCSFHPLEVTL